MIRFRQNYSTPLLLRPASITTSKEQRVCHGLCALLLSLASKVIFIRELNNVKRFRVFIALVKKEFPERLLSMKNGDKWHCSSHVITLEQRPGGTLINVTR
jgi:hypothetical protein